MTTMALKQTALSEAAFLAHVKQLAQMAGYRCYHNMYAVGSDTATWCGPTHLTS